MSGSGWYWIKLTAVTAAVTIALRALPFLIFSRGKDRQPEILAYLGKMLAPAAIAMLTVYCMAGHIETNPETWAAPEILAGAAVAAMQITVKIPLLSITAGTVLYMLLVQHVI